MQRKWWMTKEGTNVREDTWRVWAENREGLSRRPGDENSLEWREYSSVQGKHRHNLLVGLNREKSTAQGVSHRVMEQSVPGWRPGKVVVAGDTSERQESTACGHWDEWEVAEDVKIFKNQDLASTSCPEVVIQIYDGEMWVSEASGFSFLEEEGTQGYLHTPATSIPPSLRGLNSHSSCQCLTWSWNTWRSPTKYA